VVLLDAERHACLSVEHILRGLDCRGDASLMEGRDVGAAMPVANDSGVLELVLKGL